LSHDAEPIGRPVNNRHISGGASGVGRGSPAKLLTKDEAWRQLFRLLFVEGLTAAFQAGETYDRE
jgi:hypothetical protein